MSEVESQEANPPPQNDSPPQQQPQEATEAGPTTATDAIPAPATTDAAAAASTTDSSAAPATEDAKAGELNVNAAAFKPSVAATPFTPTGLNAESKPFVPGGATQQPTPAASAASMQAQYQGRRLYAPDPTQQQQQQYQQAGWQQQPPPPPPQQPVQYQQVPYQQQPVQQQMVPVQQQPQMVPVQQQQMAQQPMQQQYVQQQPVQYVQPPTQQFVQQQPMQQPMAQQPVQQQPVQQQTVMQPPGQPVQQQQQTVMQPPGQPVQQQPVTQQPAQQQQPVQQQTVMQPPGQPVQQPAEQQQAVQQQQQPAMQPHGQPPVQQQSSAQQQAVMQPPGQQEPPVQEPAAQTAMQPPGQPATEQPVEEQPPAQQPEGEQSAKQETEPQPESKPEATEEQPASQPAAQVEATTTPEKTTADASQQQSAPVAEAPASTVPQQPPAQQQTVMQPPGQAPMAQQPVQQQPVQQQPAQQAPMQQPVQQQTVMQPPGQPVQQQPMQQPGQQFVQQQPVMQPPGQQPMVQQQMQQPVQQMAPMQPAYQPVQQTMAPVPPPPPPRGPDGQPLAQRNKGYICNAVFTGRGCSMPSSQCPFQHISSGTYHPIPTEVCEAYLDEECHTDGCMKFHGKPIQLEWLRAASERYGVKTYQPEDYMVTREPFGSSLSMGRREMGDAPSYAESQQKLGPTPPMLPVAPIPLNPGLKPGETAAEKLQRAIEQARAARDQKPTTSWADAPARPAGPPQPALPVTNESTPAKAPEASAWASAFTSNAAVTPTSDGPLLKLGGLTSSTSKSDGPNITAEDLRNLVGNLDDDDDGDDVIMNMDFMKVDDGTGSSSAPSATARPPTTASGGGLGALASAIATGTPTSSNVADPFGPRESSTGSFVPVGSAVNIGSAFDSTDTTAPDSSEPVWLSPSVPRVDSLSDLQSLRVLVPKEAVYYDILKRKNLLNRLEVVLINDLVDKGDDYVPSLVQETKASAKLLVSQYPHACGILHQVGRRLDRDFKTVVTGLVSHMKLPMVIKWEDVQFVRKGTARVDLSSFHIRAVSPNNEAIDYSVKQLHHRVQFDADRVYIAKDEDAANDMQEAIRAALPMLPDKTMSKEERQKLVNERQRVTCGLPSRPLRVEFAHNQTGKFKK